MECSAKVHHLLKAPFRGVDTGQKKVVSLAENSEFSLEYREKRKELRLRKSPGWDPKPCPRLIDAGQECQVE